MAKTHMLRLERVQYRGIKLALGLMCSTPNNSLGGPQWYTTFAGKICLLELVAVFYRLGHPLREKLRDLGTMNMSRCIQGYSDVLWMDIITPSESFTRHELSACANRKRTSWGSGYNVLTVSSQGALNCDIRIC
jgi:hypothetical protein